MSLSNLSSQVFCTRSTSDIVSRLLFFRLCRNKPLVSSISKLLSQTSKNSPIQKLFKNVVYHQFCGGDDIYSSLSVADSLLSDYNVHSIVDLSSEDCTSSEQSDQILNKKLDMIKTLSSNISVKFIPIKCTSLLAPKVLENLTIHLQNRSISSSNDCVFHLSPHDKVNFDTGLARLQILCEAASKHNLSILIDAEQSFRQPAVEIVGRYLMKEFNIPLSKTSQPLVYNTYQMYLNRTKHAILRDLNVAQNEGFIFAAKVVRGAYIQSERIQGHKMKLNHLFSTKQEVDNAYNDIVRVLIDRVKMSLHSHNNLPISIIFATHNQQSMDLALHLMASNDIPHNIDCIHFAQILGMADHCTHALGLQGYNVHKLLCYGSYEDLLPWLLRRVDENQVSIRLCMLTKE